MIGLLSALFTQQFKTQYTVTQEQNVTFIGGYSQVRKFGLHKSENEFGLHKSEKMIHICCMARSLRSLRQVATLRHGHMARRFAPAFKALEYVNIAD